MKKLILLIYHFFRNLFQPKPGPREYSFSQGLSQSVYRTAPEKSEPEEKKSTPPDSDPPESIPPTNISNPLLQRSEAGFPSLTKPRSLFDPLPPLEPLEPLKPLPPLEPLPPLPPLPPLDPLPAIPPVPPLIHRTNDYSPIKNLNTKQVIQAKRVSREDALRLSHLPLTNDIAEVGDDTIRVPRRGGPDLFITADPVILDETYKAEREKFTTFINNIIDQSKEEK